MITCSIYLDINLLAYTDEDNNYLMKFWYSRTLVIRISIIQTLGYPNTIMNVEISKDSAQPSDGMLV